MSTDQPIHREQHRDYRETGDREQRYSGYITRLNGHELIAIDEWPPGKEPTPYEINLTDGFEYRTRYLRCRNCGQERNRRGVFNDQCETPPAPLEAGGFSIDEPRTCRTLSENMDVSFASVGSLYEVISESGNTYNVDIEGEMGSCPDFEQCQPDDGCKHLRRVGLEIHMGLVPTPDGTFDH
ncbi:hypothetical protein HYG81_19010 (plasmid) [Natrinema zhouii]|uniref:hypothetical protein n=1 Tax=Natrinema zhouii TaxID=1710539 RepID=UPI001CFF6F75|nr:hypothetical protein [Natrinema zhouii]UHQ98191.1 hypothetical protein HYG81_19010 [Natrinema zhouii]